MGLEGGRDFVYVAAKLLKVGGSILEKNTKFSKQHLLDQEAHPSSQAPHEEIPTNGQVPHSEAVAPNAHAASVQPPAPVQE